MPLKQSNGRVTYPRAVQAQSIAQQHLFSKQLILMSLRVHFLGHWTLI